MSAKSRSTDQEPGSFLTLQQYVVNVISAFSPGLKPRLLVALSGGADSMLLFKLLASSGLTGIGAHVNYGLRGEESDEDEQFVAKETENAGWPVEVLNASREMNAHQGESTQMAARRIRYKWFEKLRVQNHLDFIVTAHHANDNAETILINFLRGSGLNGLSGMSERNGLILRPLLKIPGETLRKVANETGLRWREDSSNDSDKYLRNRIRHHVLPVLQETDTRFFKKLEETFIRLKSEHSLLHELIALQGFSKESKEGKLMIRKADLEKVTEPAALLYQIIKEYGFSYIVCAAACSNLTAYHRRVFFSGEWQLVLERSEIHITKGIQGKNDDVSGLLNNFSFENLPGPPDFTEKTALSEAFLDPEKLTGRWNVRTRRNADRFWPSGMQGSKLISDYFTDLKLSSAEKDSQLLLCDGDDIVWVVNRRIDGRFAATKESLEILRIRFIGGISGTAV